MAINKVSYRGKVLIDLTSDTVKPQYLKKGYTAHMANGSPITGTYVGSDTSDIKSQLKGKPIITPSSDGKMIYFEYENGSVTETLNLSDAKDIITERVIIINSEATTDPVLDQNKKNVTDSGGKNVTSVFGKSYVITTTITYSESGNNIETKVVEE